MAVHYDYLTKKERELAEILSLETQKELFDLDISKFCYNHDNINHLAENEKIQFIKTIISYLDIVKRQNEIKSNN